MKRTRRSGYATARLTVARLCAQANEGTFGRYAAMPVTYGVSASFYF